MSIADPPVIDREPYERAEAGVETAFDGPYVTVEAHNAVYENPEFRSWVRPVMPDHIDQSPRALFTTGLSFSRPPPGGKTTDRLLGIAARYARREFRSSLTEDGLEAVEDAGSRDLRLRGRRTAKAFGYDADYPLAPGAVGEPGATLDVRVWAAIWATADSFAMAGGVYPLESLSDAVGRDGGAGTDSGVSIEPRPSGDRREVFDAVRAAAE
ncbi:MAG: hypothetical protein V5A30_03570 [Haloarculaceae archaeon]